MRLTPLFLALGSACLGVAAIAQSQPQRGNACGTEKQIYEEFAQATSAVTRGPGPKGAQQKDRRDLRRSKALLCETACCLPRPDSRRSYPTGEELLTTPYIPYYYLGRAYEKLGEPCYALGNLNLSDCETETASFPKQRKQLDDSRGGLWWSRPPTPTAFIEGIHAVQAKRGPPDWEKVAEKMSYALKVWDEDGEMPRSSSGRWGVDRPYLPRFFLARALFELKCYREAAVLLACSPLARCQLKDSTSEKPAVLLKEAQKRARSQKVEPGACDRWRDLPEADSEWCDCFRCQQ